MKKQILFFFTLLLFISTMVFAQNKNEATVMIKEAQLREKASFLGSITAVVPYGVKLTIKNSNPNGWFQVSGISNKKQVSGWIHKSAMSTKGIQLQAGKSTGTKAAAGEVALAGKGFKDASETLSKLKTQFNFNTANEMEKIVIDAKQLTSFIQDGKLSMSQASFALTDPTPFNNQQKTDAPPKLNRPNQKTGTITTIDSNAIDNSFQALEDSTRWYSPEEEYAIGKVTAAYICAGYNPSTSVKKINYINLLGQYLAALSARPETFSGYHFMILETNELNAFAAPGGFIFITSGMISQCKSEAELAAVLSHEIAHVQYQHGIAAIKSAATAKSFGENLQKRFPEAGSFKDNAGASYLMSSISGLMDTLSLVGYSEKAELEADAAAAVILLRAGYNPNALISVIKRISTNQNAAANVFHITHPATEDRILSLSYAIEKSDPGKKRDSMKLPANVITRFNGFAGAK